MIRGRVWELPRRRAVSPVLALALVAVAACAATTDDAPDATRTTTAAIQGGNADAADTFVVSVLDSSNDTCTGTLIAPNLVLTARHCISKDSGTSFVDCAADEFTETKAASLYRVSTDEEPSFSASPYHVTKILVPKDAKFCGNDIALLLLDKLVPKTEATPATPALDPNNASYGTTFTAIGYGTTEPGGNDDGARRRRNGIPILCQPNDGSDCDPADYEMTPAEIAAGNGLCEGDSGSGAFVTSTMTSGSPKVVGVLSRASDDGTDCTDAIYTRTDAFSQLIIEAAALAADAGGYNLPAWAGGSTAKPDAAIADDAATSTEPDESTTEPTTTDPAPAAPPADTGCSVGPTRSAGSGALWAASALAWVLACRRRRG